MGLVEPTDEELATYIRTHVRTVRAGVKASGTSCKIDGYWVIVTVEPSISQQDWPRLTPNFNVIDRR
jgi:hypothetical protein